MTIVTYCWVVAAGDGVGNGGKGVRAVLCVQHVAAAGTGAVPAPSEKSFPAMTMPPPMMTSAIRTSAMPYRPIGTFGAGAAGGAAAGCGWPAGELPGAWTLWSRCF